MVYLCSLNGHLFADDIVYRILEMIEYTNQITIKILIQIIYFKHYLMYKGMSIANLNYQHKNLDFKFESNLINLIYHM